MKTLRNKITNYSATCFNPVGSSSDWYLKHINQVYTSYYGREISLLTNHVTIQFLYFHFRIKILWQ